MKRKEALKEIESEMEAGLSRQEVFNKLSSKVKYRSDLLQYLACVPEPELKKTYKGLNHFLFGILILIGALKTITALVITANISIYLIPLSLFIPFIVFYFAIQIWYFRGNMYRPLFLLGLASLLFGIRDIDKLIVTGTGETIINLFFTFMPTIFVIIVSYYISKKVFPYYTSWGIPKEKELGIEV